MSLTKLTKSLTYHQSNADRPVMSAQELKELFDQGVVDIQDYINNTLTREVDTQKADYSNVYLKTEVYSKEDMTIINYEYDGETSPSIDLPSYFNEENIYVICSTKQTSNGLISHNTSWVITRGKDNNDNPLDHLTLVIYDLHNGESVKFIFLKTS